MPDLVYGTVEKAIHARRDFFVKADDETRYLWCKQPERKGTPAEALEAFLNKL
jgi:hypothetical protein